MRIGYIGPVTGDAAAYGSDTLNGVQIAVDHVNAQGGINGHLVELLVKDAQCNGMLAAEAARELVRDDAVSGIIGGICSGETLGAAPVVEAAGVVMISPTSSSPDITDAGQYIFRTYPSDALKTKSFARFLLQQGYEHIAVISENTEFNRAFLDVLDAHLPAGAVAFNAMVEPNMKDYTAQMEQMKGTEFDVFFANGQTPATISAMITHLRSAGLQQPVITHDAGHSNELLERAGSDAEHLLAIDILNGTEESSPFAQEFKSRFGLPRQSYILAANGHDAASVLLHALQTAGVGNGDAVREALLALESFTGEAGTFSFDRNGDVEGIPYALWQVQNGAWEMIGNIDIEGM